MTFYSPIEIRFRDLDALGHVNNAVYFSYVEQARIAYFRQIIDKNHDWKKFGVLIARNEINYYSPVHIDDHLECGLNLIKLGTKSMEYSFEFRILKDGKQIKAADGKFVLVCFDPIKQTSAPLPELWREKITAFEKRDERPQD